MQTWTFVDKSEWGQGPWTTEPDKIQWTDKATGLPCLIVRNSPEIGNLCGYVGVMEGHPAFQQEGDRLDVSVHGGLTYSSFCQTGELKEHGICHVPEPGQSDRVWWLGFDCAHCGDLAPGIIANIRKRDPSSTYGRNDVYRDVPYVHAECQQLAAQLQAMTKSEDNAE